MTREDDAKRSTDELVAQAQVQLDEHKRWLAAEIREHVPALQGDDQAANLSAQAEQIQLRVARCTNRGVVSVVWDYPDELYAFLVGDAAPQHLRDSVAGGHRLDPSKPASTWKREEGSS